MIDQSSSPSSAVYGSPLPALVEVPREAVQTSPLYPGARRMEDMADAGIAAFAMAAPPGAVERRYAMALALRSLSPSGRLSVVAPNDRGGSRLGAELTEFGCRFAESFKRRHRICIAERPDETGALDEAIAEGAPRCDPELDLWTQPGVFSWNRIDPGSALLASRLPPLAGKGADLGCGIGYLTRAALRSPKVSAVKGIDVDGRAISCAQRNVKDPRAAFLWADARTSPLKNLDFVVSNPPFHAEGSEDRGLGQSFIAAARGMLRRGGVLWLVANRHLPYESSLRSAFHAVELRAEEAGYKLFEARA